MPDIVTDTSPLMVAWQAYQATEEFAKTQMWASTGDHQHVEGALWAAFLEGFRGRERAEQEMVNERDRCAAIARGIALRACGAKNGTHHGVLAAGKFSAAIDILARILATDGRIQDSDVRRLAQEIRDESGG